MLKAHECICFWLLNLDAAGGKGNETRVVFTDLPSRTGSATSTPTWAQSSLVISQIAKHKLPSHLLPWPTRTESSKQPNGNGSFLSSKGSCCTLSMPSLATDLGIAKDELRPHTDSCAARGIAIRREAGWDRHFLPASERSINDEVLTL